MEKVQRRIFESSQKKKKIVSFSFELPLQCLKANSKEKMETPSKFNGKQQVVSLTLMQYNVM